MVHKSFLEDGDQGLSPCNFATTHSAQTNAFFHLAGLSCFQFLLCGGGLLIVNDSKWNGDGLKQHNRARTPHPEKQKKQLRPVKSACKFATTLLTVCILHIVSLFSLKGRPTPKNNRPNKSTVCANNFGTVCTNRPPLSLKNKQRQADGVAQTRCANCFYLGVFLCCWEGCPGYLVKLSDRNL